MGTNRTQGWGYDDLSRFMRASGDPEADRRAAEMATGFTPTALVPMVIETTGRGERAFDIYSLLLKERIVFIGTAVDDQVANLAIAQMLYLAREDPERDIQLYINSPGGSVTAGLAIYDTMELISPDVSTICMGLAASMATVLLASGQKGKRYALPSATIMMHQASGGAQGVATDIEIVAREIIRINSLIRQILVDKTGQPMERIARDFDRDFYMTAQDARNYGLIDEVLSRPSQMRELTQSDGAGTSLLNGGSREPETVREPDTDGGSGFRR